MHVLLVDRQAAARSVLRSVLSEFSANVDEAHDVASAELLLARTQFDLALLDLSPPDFVALDVLRTLRQKESGSTRAPAVLFIAAEDVAKMPQAAELGVAHFQP